MDSNQNIRNNVVFVRVSVFSVRNITSLCCGWIVAYTIKLIPETHGGLANQLVRSIT
jgi:hypothetical protein